MPRINIEQKWWSDPRRSMLMLKLGFKEADGAMLNAIKLSQDYNGQAFDASKILPKEWINALIDTGLADGTPRNFYVSGSKEHHDWILRQRELAKRGGQATKNKISSLQEAIARPVAGPSSSSSSTTSKEVVVSNDAQKFEDRFNFTKVWPLEILEKSFKLINPAAAVPPSLKRKTHLIEKVFGTEEAFKLWAEDVLNSEQCKETRYFAVAVLREIGERA